MRIDNSPLVPFAGDRSGADAGNYNLVQQSGLSADITAPGTSSLLPNEIGKNINVATPNLQVVQPKADSNADLINLASPSDLATQEPYPHTGSLMLKGPN